MPPVVTQANPSEAAVKLYDLQPVGDPETTDTWDLEVEGVAEDHPLCAIACPNTSFTVTRAFPTQTVKIRTLRIHRHLNEGVRVTVSLATPSGTLPLHSVQEIIADVQGVPGEAGLHGTVRVFAGLEASFGKCENVNDLDVQAGGDIGGPLQPIFCVMHPSAPAIPDPTDEHSSSVRLESFGGSLLGDVTMEPSPGVAPVRGVIEWLKFASGTIGSSSSAPVAISADGVIAAVIAGECHANFRGTSTGPGMDSFVHLVTGMEIGYASGGSGEFTGEIRAERIGYSDQYDVAKFGLPLYLAGPVHANIWVQEVPHPFIQVAIHQGQMFGIGAVGVLDYTVGPGVWTGPFALMPLGQIATTPTETNPNHWIFNHQDAEGYTPPRTALSLGGGSIGLVPFPQHLESCTPAKPIDGSPIEINTMAERPGPSNEIRVRSYGPVVWDPAVSDFPLVIQRRRAGSSDENAWRACDEPLGTCTGYLQYPDPNDSRTVVIRPPWNLQRGYEYRVVPRIVGGTTVLRSDMPHLDTAFDPPVSTSTTAPVLTFTICTDLLPGQALGATGDADDDGDVDFADITRVLLNWCETGGCACFPLGDADRDGDADFADITAITANWGQAYCAALGQSLLAKSDGFATMDLDQDAPMTAADAVGVITAALIQMGYESIEAFGDALSHMTPEQRTAEMRTLGSLLPGGHD